jgi:hypothetical protein
MTGEYIELTIEFSVILLAPIIHTIYLRKVKKVDSSVIQQNIKIFSFFYALIAICVVVILTMPKAHANELHRHTANPMTGCVSLRIITVTRYFADAIRVTEKQPQSYFLYGSNGSSRLLTS